MSEHGVNRKIRDSVVAGIFYPDDASALRLAVESSMKGFERGDALAIMSPHAGFDYAGAVQGAAWSAAAARDVERVVILAPCASRGRSAVYLPESDICKTPLGDIQVDVGTCVELESCGTIFETNDLPHLEEYAIETQLPFMRELFPKACLVPLLVSGSDPMVAVTLARSLELVLGEEWRSTLFVVSANLAASMVIADAERRSNDILAAMAEGDWRKVCGLQCKDATPSCGSTVIAGVMASRFLDKARFRIEKRSDSRSRSDAGPDRVVFYAAAAWYGGP